MCQDNTQEERENRIAFVSVRPDWMDNRGLLGYFNPLNDRYYATPILRLLLSAEKNPDKPYFLILDEMNLAKVEYYFSDFLSILESRTAKNPDGEPLLLHDLEEVTAYGNDNLKIPSKLNIPPNVYITGTVNVDETTYMFSPKVLDRANIIEFNQVTLENISNDYFELPTELEELPDNKQEGEYPYLELELNNPDVRSDLLIKDNFFPSLEDYRKALDNTETSGGMSLIVINWLINLMERYHLHFGYRVISEISRFTWLALESESMIGPAAPKHTIIDIQILQKVLPKIHGTRAKLERPLQDLIAFCYDPAPNRSMDISEEKRQQAEKFDTSACFPRTAQKCARMLRNLQEQGYASFIE
jgi:GTPase subunit of restriction endonuclease